MLADKARKWIDKDERAPGIHASSILDPRQHFWATKDPQEHSDGLVNIFLIGKVLHAFVLGAVDGSVDINTTDDGSFRSEELGITYSPDKVKDGIVRELKTSRSPKEPRDISDVDTYIEQLLVYMAATDTTTSELWVLYINLRENGRTSPAFRCYTVTISADDLAKTKEFIKATRADLQKALETDDWTGLDLCHAFKCGENNCAWFNKCKPEGRHGIARNAWTE